MLDPLQVDVTEAGTCHPLQTVHIVLIDLYTEHLWVTLNVVPLCVQLQRLLDGLILQPSEQFGRVNQVVDNTLEREMLTLAHLFIYFDTGILEVLSEFISQPSSVALK